MALILLNTLQKKKLEDLFGFYNYFYICNECGSLYGSDQKEHILLCPTCELIKKKEKKWERKLLYMMKQQE